MSSHDDQGLAREMGVPPQMFYQATNALIVQHPTGELVSHRNASGIVPVLSQLFVELLLFLFG